MEPKDVIWPDHTETGLKINAGESCQAGPVSRYIGVKSNCSK